MMYQPAIQVVIASSLFYGSLSRCKPGKGGEACNITCAANCRGELCVSKRESDESCKDCDNVPKCMDHLCDNDGMCYLCDTGLYGYNCSSKCSNKCDHSVCNAKNGSCFSCPKGFYGSNCTTPCPETCNERGCSEKGRCIQCDTFYYGIECTLHCSDNCLNRLCDSSSGFCLKGCVPGFYGEMCSVFCPRGCDSQTCHSELGNCFICHIGFQGPFCNISCPPNCLYNTCNMTNGFCIDGEVHRQSPAISILFLGGIIVCFAAIIIFLHRRGSSEAMQPIECIFEE